MVASLYADAVDLVFLECVCHSLSQPVREWAWVSESPSHSPTPPPMQWVSKWVGGGNFPDDCCLGFTTRLFAPPSVHARLLAPPSVHARLLAPPSVPLSESLTLLVCSPHQRILRYPLLLRTILKLLDTSSLEHQCLLGGCTLTIIRDCSEYAQYPNMKYEKMKYDISHT